MRRIKINSAGARVKINGIGTTVSINNAASDEGAATYISALNTAGAKVTPTHEALIERFFTNLSSFGLENFDLFYLPVWFNSTANKINILNPGTNDLTYNAEQTHSFNGIKPTGVASRLYTDYTATGLTATDAHLSIFNSINPYGIIKNYWWTNQTPLFPAGNAMSIVADVAARLAFGADHTVTITNNNSGGLELGTRVGNDMKLWKNGTELINLTTSQTAKTIPAQEMWLIVSGAQDKNASKILSFSLGKGVTLEQYNNLKSILNDFFDGIGIGINATVSNPIASQGDNWVLGFGDSVLYGYDNTATRNVNRWFKKLVDSHSEWYELNRGITGATLQSGGASLSRSVFDVDEIPYYRSQYKNLILAYGVNDFYCTLSNPGTCSLASFISEYTTYLTAILAKGWEADKIVLCSPAYDSNQAANQAVYDSFTQAVLDLADDFGTKVFNVDAYFKTHNDIPSLLIDAVHLSDAGNEFYKQGIETIINS